MQKDIYKEVLIIVPVLNESSRIGNVISNLKEAGFNHILIVDDGSSDNSSSVAKSGGAAIVRHMLNRGAGAATETGLEYFRRSPAYQFAVTIDGDNQHSPDDIECMLQNHIDLKADLTIGDRFLSGLNEIPRSRIIYNWIADRITSVLSWKKVSDSQSGFKIWSRRAVEAIKIEQNGYEFCSEVIIKAHHYNLKVINFPIKVFYPKELKGKGQSFFVGVKTFTNLIHHTLFKS